MSICQSIAAATGRKAADLLLRGGTVVNVFSGELERADVAIAGGLVAGVGEGYEAVEEIDCTGMYLCPGLIDAHVHLESSSVTLPEFARAVVPRGVTTVILDPHEIANVHGVAGVEYVLRSRAGVPLSAFVMAPSCVPATHMETAGAELTAEDIGTLLGLDGVLGLAEMMNFPGVLFCDPGVIGKLDAARRVGAVIDGHAPGLGGRDLNAYIGAGIDSDHECTTAAEALEKLRRGMYVLIREGSNARNLADIVPIVTEANSRRCCFCTDDRHADDLLAEGGVDYLIRKAVGLGLPAITALRMATLNAAEHFGLDRRGYGAIAPGRRADIAIVPDLDDLRPARVLVGGELVAEDGRLIVDLPASPATLPISMNIDWTSLDDLSVGAPAERTRLRVIEALEGQVLTGSSIHEALVIDGAAVADIERDILKLAVIERHRGSANMGLGFVHGFGLKRGALASSVAHDAHNIVVVGTNDDDMRAAMRALAEVGGGQVAVCDGEVRAMLELPIAGLLSEKPLAEVAAATDRLNRSAAELGCALHAAFMALSFLALPVIPALKLTDMGLVDVGAFDFVELWVE